MVFYLTLYQLVYLRIWWSESYFPPYEIKVKG